MGSQSPVMVSAASPRTSPCWGQEGDALMYAGSSLGSAVGYVNCCGDVYDRHDQKVGHVMVTWDGNGAIFRGDDDEVGHVTVARNGDGYVCVGRDPTVRGVVTARGDIYAGRYDHKVAVVKPRVDVTRMGAVALLLGVLSPAEEARRT